MIDWSGKTLYKGQTPRADLRKWVGISALALTAVGGYWYFTGGWVRVYGWLQNLLSAFFF